MTPSCRVWTLALLLVAAWAGVGRAQSDGEIRLYRYDYNGIRGGLNVLFAVENGGGVVVAPDSVTGGWLPLKTDRPAVDRFVSRLSLPVGDPTRRILGDGWFRADQAAWDAAAWARFVGWTERAAGSSERVGALRVVGVNRLLRDPRGEGALLARFFFGRPTLELSDVERLLNGLGRAEGWTDFYGNRRPVLRGRLREQIGTDAVFQALLEQVKVGGKTTLTDDERQRLRSVGIPPTVISAVWTQSGNGGIITMGVFIFLFIVWVGYKFIKAIVSNAAAPTPQVQSGQTLSQQLASPATVSSTQTAWVSKVDWKLAGNPTYGVTATPAPAPTPVEPKPQVPVAQVKEPPDWLRLVERKRREMGAASGDLSAWSVGLFIDGCPYTLDLTGVPTATLVATTEAFLRFAKRFRLPETVIRLQLRDFEGRRLVEGLCDRLGLRQTFDKDRLRVSLPDADARWATIGSEALSKAARLASELPVEPPPPPPPTTLHEFLTRQFAAATSQPPAVRAHLSQLAAVVRAQPTLLGLMTELGRIAISRPAADQAAEAAHRFVFEQINRWLLVERDVKHDSYPADDLTAGILVYASLIQSLSGYKPTAPAEAESLAQPMLIAQRFRPTMDEPTWQGEVRRAAPACQDAFRQMFAA